MYIYIYIYIYICDPTPKTPGSCLCKDPLGDPLTAASEVGDRQVLANPSCQGCQAGIRTMTPIADRHTFLGPSKREQHSDKHPTVFVFIRGLILKIVGMLEILTVRDSEI